MGRLAGLCLFGSIGACLAILAGCGGNSFSSPGQAELTRGFTPTPYALSISRMKQLTLGMREYLTDSDGSFPLSNWMTVLKIYVPDESAFHSPAVAAPGYGYAFNKDLVGATIGSLDHPEREVMLFDSKNVSFNAVGSIYTWPTPGRYNGKNTLGFADGYVRDDPNTQGFHEAVYRARGINNALHTYARDHSGVFPKADHWMDLIKPYLLSERILTTPALPEGKYGYAINSAIAGQNINLFDASTTVSVFDSTVTRRNAVSTTATLPNPGRYNGHNAIVYLSGSVK